MKLTSAWHGHIRHVAVAIALAAASFETISACTSTPPHTEVRQAEDLVEPDAGLTFDPNTVIDTTSFTDSHTVDQFTIQGFLDRTPYNRPSFLGTYQSDGVLASEALEILGDQYAINALFLIVRAQMEEGLIAEQEYPFPPARVEYLFGCGCSGNGVCDPELAGFRKQADCLARQVRTSLDEIARNGVTAGGWGPNKESVTLDGVHVTPTNDATAALYQHLPVVGDKKRGVWLFWNLWQKYSLAVEYRLPGE